jgi:hypothetical protein
MVWIWYFSYFMTESILIAADVFDDPGIAMKTEKEGGVY